MNGKNYHFLKYVERLSPFSKLLKNALPYLPAFLNSSIISLVFLVGGEEKISF